MSSERPESPCNNATSSSQIVSTSAQNQSTSSLASHSNGNKLNSSNEQQTKNRICRDFVRGSCRRLYCKYPHVMSTELVVFCHDFQNNKCPRINCKFLHYTVDEEEYYRRHGEFPIGGQQSQQQDSDFGNNQNLNNGNNGGDYSGDYEYEFSGGFFSNSNSSNGNRIPSLLDSDLFHPCQSQRMDGGCGLHCHDRGYSNGPPNGFRNGLKRLGSQDRGDFLQQQPKFKRSREDELMAILRRFEEEHLMLKRRVEANELKIAELRASNEYLMTQNAQLRLSTVQVSRVVNPVTVTNTQSQQTTPAPQVINASMAPIQVATPIVSMAAPQTQILTTPPNCNVATPIAIHATANTSQQTQQILGTPQITLAPAALSAPSIGLSINNSLVNTSQALQAAISNASQPIISYPIMTHSILPH